MNPNAWLPTLTREKIQDQSWVASGGSLLRIADAARLVNLVEGFAPISLKEMDTVALLNRIDTKFLLTTSQLEWVLSALQPEYRVLSVRGQRMTHYRTLYFDTPNFDLYNLHVNGRADRFKVRSREYIDSHLSFLEVKHRTCKDRTIKSRIPTNQQVIGLSGDTEDWLDGVIPYDSRSLEPKIWNSFTRITLVSKIDCERVTLDVDLTFNTGSDNAHLNGIAVAEVKLDNRNCKSPFLALMRDQRIHPQGFSKYCIGTSLLYANVKKNSLKRKLIWIEKITNGVNHE